MKALVVFESMFGNTALLARSIADGLAARMDVERVAACGSELSVKAATRRSETRPRSRAARTWWKRS